MAINLRRLLSPAADLSRPQLLISYFKSELPDSAQRFLSNSTEQQQNQEEIVSKTEEEESSAQGGGDEDDDGDYEDVNEETGEVGGPRGPEPTRYGDWEKNGRCYDF